MDNQKNRLKNFGWGEAIVVIIIIALPIWGHLRKKSLEKNRVYTRGVIIGEIKGAKGSVYVGYKFWVNGVEFQGSVVPSLCKGCLVGDTVIIKYDFVNPDNNGLVKSLPKDMMLQP